ncbi:c-type cytochrome [Vibrio sp. T187]|uniref:c-type cytochrome n=1 Tax=Vibrio TaxID=662 RepID=UPI0035BC4158
MMIKPVMKICGFGMIAAVVLSLSACSDEVSPSEERKIALAAPTLSVDGTQDGQLREEEYMPSLAGGERLVNNLCSQCHGDKVIPFVQSYPNIKGQKASYILKQLRDFKSDQRQDLYMQSVVKPLTDQDLQDAAAYYSTLTPLDLYQRNKEYYHP